MIIGCILLEASEDVVPYIGGYLKPHVACQRDRVTIVIDLPTTDMWLRAKGPGGNGSLCESYRIYMELEPRGYFWVDVCTIYKALLVPVFKSMIIEC